VEKEARGRSSTESRSTKTTKTRRYRYTKKRPRSQKAMFIMDRGNVEQQITLFFPHNTEIQDHEHKKQPNPDLVRINLGEISLVFYKSTKRGFVYDKHSAYCGSFEKHDLKHAFYRIGVLLSSEKN
jgi:hypothetical protein